MKAGRFWIAVGAKKGNIFSINVRTRSVVAVILLMATVSSSLAGINSVNDQRGSIYFTNTSLNIFGKIRVKSEGILKSNATIYANVTAPDHSVVEFFGKIIISGQVA